MKAKNVDKSRLMQDKPTQITVTRSVTEILNQLEALRVIEGSTDEPTDAEVVESAEPRPELPR